MPLWTACVAAWRVGEITYESSEANEKMTVTTLRFSQLSASRQTLVRLCQSVNHGSIEDLRVEQSEPVFNPAPVVLKDVKLDSEEGPRPELALADFVVSNEVLRLKMLFDEMRCGVIRHIEVRGGIPRRIVLESHA
jgi:hypothetical protein